MTVHYGIVVQETKKGKQQMHEPVHIPELKTWLALSYLALLLASAA